MRRPRRPARAPDDRGREPAPDADPESVAKAMCLRQLAVRPRSRSELARTLADRDTDDAVAAKVLDRLTEVGLVDDAEYAATFVRSRHQTQGLSRRALSYGLRGKGIDDEQIEAALDGLSPENEEQRARELVERRLPSLRAQPREVQMRRLAGLLGRKGYPAGVAFRVVRDVLDGVPAGDLD